jgi:DNA-binding MarR family transcriptional regulator
MANPPTDANGPGTESRAPLSWLILEAFYYTRRSFDEAVREYGVSASQLGVLNRLAEHPGLSGAELARLMLTTSQAAQLMLATLERKGLVRRARDPRHGRIVRSRLTAKGGRIVTACRPVAWEMEARLGAGLDADARDELADLLHRYTDRARSGLD